MWGRLYAGSTFGDRLENDRAYAQSVLADLGMATCATHEFATAQAALASGSIHAAVLAAANLLHAK